METQNLPGGQIYSKLVFFFFFLIYLFIYLFLAVLGLCCWAWAFSSCSGRGLLFVAVRGLLTVVASLVVEHRLQARGLQQLWHLGSVVVARGLQSTVSVVVVYGLSSCGARAQLLRSMWDLPGPGLEPVSPVLAGGFLTTAPRGFHLTKATIVQIFSTIELLPLLELHIKRIIHYFFCVRLTLRFLRFIHDIVCIVRLFLFTVE